LIKGGTSRSAVGILIERTSRSVMLAKHDRASATSVLDGCTQRLGSVPESLRKTLTHDQGTEPLLHQTLATRPHIAID
jgi:IS30 family transposase